MASVTVPRQARLPLRMAASIVAQGIRIRLGRSLVTISGIVLGIAFLASILGSQALRRGLAQEDRLREEANRMYGYLVAETGSLAKRPIAVVVTGEPSAEEVRLLQRLEREKVAEFRLWSKSPPLPDATFDQLSPRVVSDPHALGAGAACVVTLGDRGLSSVGLSEDAGALRKSIVAVTREPRDAQLGGLNPVRLQRALSGEERSRRAKELARERFRGLWIVAISLLVTVIGITNAMLMSVTERFRDIGTMKCLGATSRFIRQIFLLEASFMGLVGGALGLVLGLAVSLATYFALYDAGLVARTIRAELPALALGSGQALLAGVALSVIAALYPARFAARMVPADALRSNV